MSFVIVYRALAEAPEEPPEYVPDAVFARMVENPVSGIIRLSIANATQFGIPPNKRVANATVLAPIIPALFKHGWSIVTRTTLVTRNVWSVGKDRERADVNRLFLE